MIATESSISRWADTTSTGDYWFTSIADVKRANAEIGHHWFEPQAMRFFQSRISRDLIGGRWFVSSERGWDDVRKYTVRVVRADGAIDTEGGFDAFQAYATSAEATAAARKFARDHHIN